MMISVSECRACACAVWIDHLEMKSGADECVALEDKRRDLFVVSNLRLQGLSSRNGSSRILNELISLLGLGLHELFRFG
jgi:hypothetical protein